MTTKERLEQYIEKDKIYQDFINSKIRIKDLTDFGKFCIQHCKDIEELLEENQELKKQLEEWKELLNKFKTQQKEFIEWLEDMLDNENDIFSVVRVKDVLQKYKEIIGDDK